ncbi:MAG: (2Fe-2S)-binding protein [Bacteroidetes bacterium]|jgi:NAD(P)H-nitrite reductase large subunit|nr:(2Fe-2S)-binding protein [Bacteroidota bacterium]
MENDSKICFCKNIYKSEIIKAIKDFNLNTIEDIQIATEAGSICGTCLIDVRVILKQQLENK